MKLKLKKRYLLLPALVGMLACLITGCGKKGLSGVYNGSTGQSQGEVSATMTFDESGTVTYERIRNVSKGFGEGSEEVTETFSGVWSETDEDDTFEILVDGIYGTLYGKLSDSGDLVISSDGIDWKTETFTTAE